MRTVIFVMCIAAAFCPAATILDQHFEYDDCAAYPVCGGSVGRADNAQTFTAGLAGLITRIDVLVQRLNINSGNLLFDLLPTVGSVPVENLDRSFASIVRPALGIAMEPQWISFDLTSFGVSIHPGDMLAIVLRDTTATCCATYLWRGSFDGSIYAGGQRYLRGDDISGPVWNGGTLGTPPSNQANIDLDFRVFVDTEPARAPEPGTWALTILGMSALALATGGPVGAKRRQRGDAGERQRGGGRNRMETPGNR